jgi:hypothetical protein
MLRKPRTVAKAVEWLEQELPADTLDFIRGTPSKDELAGLHFSLGMYIRNEFGLWSRNSALLTDCGFAADNGLAADGASAVILEALRHKLIETATPEERARGQQRWERCQRERAVVADREAAKDALITSRRCLQCGRPCPRYRLTCKYCRHLMGREPQS